MKHSILIIDDEPQILKFVGIALNAEGYLCHFAPTAAEAKQILTSQTINLVILDLGLPDLDGFTLLKELRQTSLLPVLVLTARDAESEKIRLLEGGANDYLSKPFSIKELVVRIKVLLRDLPHLANQKPLYLKGLRLDPINQRVFLNEMPIALTKKEAAFLVLLMAHPGTLVTQHTLLCQIWGQSHSEDTHYLRVLVRQLRKKLHDDAENPQFIKTEAGVGYRFLSAPNNDS